MSSEHERPDDRELEEWIEGKSPLSSAYREASRESAPPELDAAILAAARQAAAQPAKRAARRPRWLRPLAFAATFVLSLGVLLSVYRDPALRQAVVPGEDFDHLQAPPFDAAKQAPVAPTGFEGDETVERKAEQPFADQDNNLAKQKRDAASSERELRMRERFDDARESTSPLRGEPYGSFSEEPPRAATTAPPPPPAPIEHDAVAPPATPPATQAAPPKPNLGRAAEAAPPSPAADGAAGAANAGSAAEPASESVAPMSRDTYGSEDRQPAPDAGAAAQKKSAPMLESSTSVPPDNRAMRHADDRGEPLDAAWQRIRDLRARGDVEGARRAFEELRKRYPDAEVPTDLLGLLKEER